MESEFMRKMRAQAVATAAKVERDTNNAKLRNWPDMERMYLQQGWTNRQIADEKARVAQAVYSGSALNGLGQITRENLASSFQQSSLRNDPDTKDVFDYLAKFTKDFTDWRIIDASVSVREVYDGFVAKLSAATSPAVPDALKEIARQNPNIIIARPAPLPEAKVPDNDLQKGDSGYIAFYKGKKLELYADSKLEAQKKAAKHFGAKKAYDVNVEFAERREPAPQSIPEPTAPPFFKVGDKVLRNPMYSSDMFKDIVGEILSEGKWSRLPHNNTYEYTYRVKWDSVDKIEENALESHLGKLKEPKPKYEVGDRLRKTDGTGPAGEVTKINKLDDKGNYAYLLETGPMYVGAKRTSVWVQEDMLTMAESVQDNYVNEGKAAIKELLAKGKKSTPKAKPKFKKGQYAMVSDIVEYPKLHGTVGKIEDVHTMNETYFSYYAPEWGGVMISEVDLVPATKKNYDDYHKKAAPATPAKKAKAKFKVGQFVVFLENGRIVQIEEADHKTDTYAPSFGPGWYYREKTMGWQHESQLTLANKDAYNRQESDRDYAGSNKTLGTSEEQKHFKALIKNTSATTKDSLTKAYKALQRAITSGKIRKGSPNADLVMEVQTAYYEALKEGSPYRVKLSDSDLAKYVYLVNGPKIYRSVRAINYLIGQYDTEMSPQRVATVLKYLESLRVPKTEPFGERVHGAIATLKANLKNGLSAGYAKAVDLQGLGKIETLLGLGFACGCGGAGSAKPLAGLGSLDYRSSTERAMPAATKDSMTAHELEKLNYATYPLAGKWSELIGYPQTNFALMIWGSPGAGKSTLAMQFSKYLAENHGNVLYVSSEEFPSYTLKNKLNLVGGAAYGWEFSKTLNALRADHKFLVIDSTNHYKFTTADLKALKARRPDLSIILIVQITKGGNFKGDQSIEHEVDAVVKVTQEGATTIKNRFKELSSVPVFDEY